MSRRLPKWVFSVILAVSCLLFGSAINAEDDISEDELSDIVQRVRERLAVPGLVASVGYLDGRIQTAADGVRLKGTSDTVAGDDRFHIGSVTKPFTATLIGILIDKKVLSWDTSITESLSECADTMRDEYQDVTIAQLLAHESGLAPFTDDKDFERLVTTGAPRAQRLHFACTALSRDPASSPGTGYQYSNAGFIVAAAIAEQKTGEDWEDLVMKHLIQPLGLSSAGFGWPARTHESSPRGHWGLTGGEAVPLDPHGEYQLPVVLAPAGDLHMSTPDLARFLVEHLKAMRGESSIISSDTARTMHTPRLRSGLGWGIQDLLGFENLSVHQGSAETFVTMVAILPENDFVIAVSTNDGTEAGGAASSQTLKAILKFIADSD